MQNHTRHDGVVAVVWSPRRPFSGALVVALSVVVPNVILLINSCRVLFQIITTDLVHALEPWVYVLMSGFM